jgi:hypothetical protein
MTPQAFFFLQWASNVVRAVELDFFDQRGAQRLGQIAHTDEINL